MQQMFFLTINEIHDILDNLFKKNPLNFFFFSMSWVSYLGSKMVVALTIVILHNFPF